VGRRSSARGPLTPTVAPGGRDATSGHASAIGDEGLFGPESVAWRLDREATLLLGAGPRALLLQLAHPSVAAGVAEHSDFRRDPWRRLDGTLRSYLRIVYGSTAVARAEIGRLNRLHGSITGPGYRARDPELGMWVHATLVDSTLAAYAAWMRPLDAGEAERFYAEMRPIGAAFGIPESRNPADLAAFRWYLDEMLAPVGPVHVSPTARELAEAILHPPLPGPLGRVPLPTALYDWTLWPALDLLPAGVRAEYDFPDGPLRSAVTRWLVGGWRAWMPLLPRGFRQMPQALAADRRTGADALTRAGVAIGRRRG
jgi:uncharacterized protein (DUF2236 family)